MGSSLARLLAMTQRGQQPGQNPLEAMIAMQQGMAPRPMSAPQNPIPTPAPQQNLPRPRVAGSVPGVLSRFNQTVMNTLAPNPGEQVQGLIGADAIKSAQSQALLSLGAGLLSNSGWSDRPVTLGEALGKGLQASQATYGQAINTAVDNATNAQNAQSWQEQRQAAATASAELARQRETERLANEAIARARPGYAKFNAGWDTLTEDQKTSRYEAWLNEAAQVGDEATVQRLQGLLVARQQMAGKREPVNKYTEVRTDEGVYMVDPTDPTKKVRVGSDAPRGGSGGSGSGDDYGKTPVGGAMGRVAKATQDITTRVESLRAQQQRLSTNAKSPTEQIAVLYDFIRLRDNSTVRDGERELVAKANSLLGRFNLTIEKLQNGALLTPQQIRDMMRIMESEIEAKRKGLDASTAMDRAVLRGAGIPITTADSVFRTPVTGARPVVRTSDAAKRLGLIP